MKLNTEVARAKAIFYSGITILIMCGMLAYFKKELPWLKQYLEHSVNVGSPIDAMLNSLVENSFGVYGMGAVVILFCVLILVMAFMAEVKKQG